MLERLLASDRGLPAIVIAILSGAIGGRPFARRLSRILALIGGCLPALALLLLRVPLVCPCGMIFRSGSSYHVCLLPVVVGCVSFMRHRSLWHGIVRLNNLAGPRQELPLLQSFSHNTGIVPFNFPVYKPPDPSNDKVLKPTGHLQLSPALSSKDNFLAQITLHR